MSDPNNPLQELERRFTALERRHNRMRMTLISLVGFLSASLLIGAAKPNIVRARAFQVMGENGKLVGEFSYDWGSKSAAIKLYENKEGSDRKMVRVALIGGEYPKLSLYHDEELFPWTSLSTHGLQIGGIGSKGKIELNVVPGFDDMPSITMLTYNVQEKQDTDGNGEEEKDDGSPKTVIKNSICLPLQQNSWVSLGSGSRPRVW